MLVGWSLAPSQFSCGPCHEGYTSWSANSGLVDFPTQLNCVPLRMKKKTAGESANSGSSRRRFSLDYLQSIANISPYAGCRDRNECDYGSYAENTHNCVRSSNNGICMNNAGLSDIHYIKYINKFCYTFIE